MELNPFRKDALRRACCSSAKSHDAWQSLAAIAATDAEIVEMLARQMGAPGGTSGPGLLPECHASNPPRVWIGMVVPKGPPTLSGKALIRFVRDMFGIHQPPPQGQFQLFNLD